jgi:dTDP-4-amino-4,6-dideoxygalactose transaminase
MIPKHYSGLRSRDYGTYLAAGVLDRRYRSLEVEEVWSGLLPRRRLYGTPTGRHAWWYFLRAAGLEEGDEILIPAFNFYIMVRLALQRGLVPVFVDIDPETLTLDVEDLTRKISKRSRGVLVTHMFGHPANLGAISAVCRDAGLLLFEDCAHAVGTRVGDEQVGQTGDGALFSFGIQKLVNSFGGGLLALTEELGAGFSAPPHRVSRLQSASDSFGRFAISLLTAPALYRWTLSPGERLSTRLLDRGIPGLKQKLDPSRDDPEYRFVEHQRAPFKPYMLRMHQLQLARLEENIARRRTIVARIKETLRGTDGVGLLDEDKYGRANASYLGVYVPDPKHTARRLLRRGIGSGPQEFLDCAGLVQFSPWAARCENADHASTHLLRLPSYPSLTDRQVDCIGHEVKRALDAGSSADR